MNIFLTFDYELFFGKKSGTIEKCIIEPTNQLINIAKKHSIKLTFFIDCGYLVTLTKSSVDFPILRKEYELVSNQIKELSDLGHACELHIHPHWENTVFNGNEWLFDTSNYKLTDFTEEEISGIFLKYKKALETITGKPTNVYRAGGWCLQPFSKIKKSFLEMGIKMDSTVYKNGYLDSDTHFYDFRNAPDKDNWRFTDDLCIEDINGEFLEIPISSFRYNPFFFWKLYGLGRLFPSRHKSIGDGIPIAAKGVKMKYLTSSQFLPVSCDGFFASSLNQALHSLEKSGKKNMVIIGHPKACTKYSIKALDNFILKGKVRNSFTTLASLLE